MKNKKTIIIVVLLVFSIIGNGVLFIQNQSLKEATAEKETALTDANNQLTELQSSVTDLQTQVEELQAKSTEKTTNASSDESLNSKSPNKEGEIESYDLDLTSDEVSPSEAGSSVGVVTEIESSEETLGKTIESNSTENEQISQENEDSYTVEKGDTLATISMKLYGNKDMVEKICELNNIENDNKLKEGQKLLLP
ncbi:LysM peptidoglycan-binding domain-containing protein [Konateibacter massiliensis]|uniref:LysM peptidoglycan-binding domain-containing protein n=1 Tax=Konateibacter massiliensis TaxID=2002841 RepID=UPI000C15C90D|nr:LysM peptidoglycan-binding domain-containing protein [Konateibacter massiliensis]